MTQQRFLQIRELFESVLTRSPETRAAFLADACAGDSSLGEEVEQLLAADAATNGVIDMPAMAQRWGVHPPKLDGQRIGPYEILRELGKGGMGSVYLARRADGVYPKLVALKVLRSDYTSPDLLQRFEQERRILASLEHPNIARLFDGGGTPEGLPFYVMEFVEGQPIDQYCDIRRLDIRARLDLFRQVCAAADCAHRNGVVHRDLKPSNILVTAEGQVKLLDFGIAKLLQKDAAGATLLMTAAGLCVMTPEYASPEQVMEGEVTRATDVYCLGVVLYEMLTGHRPYRLKSRVFHEILRVVCEEQPILPSVAVDLAPEDPGTNPDTIGRLRQTTVGDLRKQLSGDLNSILMKALRKEPWQRYGSAAELGDDLRRYLDGLPVAARSGRYYRFWKRLNLHRGWLIAIVFLTALFATGGIRLTWPAIWVGAAGAALLAMWRIGADRELARRIAGGPAWLVLKAVVIIAFIVSVAGLDFISGFMRGVQEAHLPAPRPTDFNSDEPFWILKLLWCIPLGLLFARWAVRSRWGGGLVLDASRGRNKLLGALTAAIVLGVPARVGWLASHGELPANPLPGLFFLITDALLWVFLYALSNRLEFRQYGISTATGFYRWSNIESYTWIEDVWRNHTVLSLKMRGRHPIFPPVRMKLAKAKRAEAAGVMERFLSEWPAAFPGTHAQNPE